VTFLGGQPPDVVARWLRAADFAAQPSHFEAMGLAAAEEMAAGLPVIATNTGGYRDFVTDGETGLLVAVGDIVALATALSTLASDAGLRARMGRQARARAEEFDENVVLERFARLIEELAARG
jgi:glycosyltransferase involved in cell wall biosynthesis